MTRMRCFMFCSAGGTRGLSGRSFLFVSLFLSKIFLCDSMNPRVKCDGYQLKALKTAVEIGSITQAAGTWAIRSRADRDAQAARAGDRLSAPAPPRTKGVRLTEAGEAVMPYIDRVLESSRALERALADHAPARAHPARWLVYQHHPRHPAAQHGLSASSIPDVQFTIPRRQLHGYRAVARRQEN